jgi:hypothetical protein
MYYTFIVARILATAANMFLSVSVQYNLPYIFADRFTLVYEYAIIIRTRTIFEGITSIEHALITVLLLLLRVFLLSFGWSVAV